MDLCTSQTRCWFFKLSTNQKDANQTLKQDERLGSISSTFGYFQGWGGSSAEEHLPCIWETLGLIPDTKKINHISKHFY